MNAPFPEIKRTPISAERLSELKSERDFVGVGVDLMIETASYVTIAASMLGADGTWNLEQAIVGGNMVRLYKLFSAMLDQTVQHRRETSFIMARLTFETIVTIRYLIKEHSPELSRSYLCHSLAHEKKQRERIVEEIEGRSGLVLPIEDRMLKSIDRAFSIVEIEPGDLPRRREQNWGSKTIYDKAEAVGLESAYQSMFGGPSHNVHGSWADLYTHHLEVVAPGKFKPVIGWNIPRPQLLYSISCVSLDAIRDFLWFIGGDDLEDHFSEELDDLESRLRQTDTAHEAYLAGKIWPAI